MLLVKCVAYSGCTIGLGSVVLMTVVYKIRIYKLCIKMRSSQRKNCI